MHRRSDLDALRGLLLVLMTLTHLPTLCSVYSSQIFGFVSAAEGFVFLSAFVTGLIHTRRLATDGEHAVRSNLLLRARQLYRWHLGLLLFAFTVCAAIGIFAERPVLPHLLSFYFEQPATALWAAPLLLYQPPLLDILPMYVVFIALTPWVLTAGARDGWNRVLMLSALVWLFAQIGGRGLLLAGFNRLTGGALPAIPEQALGAFDCLAWQLLWISGLWIGAASAGAAHSGNLTLSPAMRGAALAAVLGFLAWYHDIGGIWPGRQQPLLFDKVHLRPLRLINFAVLAVTASWIVPVLLRSAHGLALLGRASLQVFSMHLLLCLLSLGLVTQDDVPLTLWQQSAVLTATFSVMLLTAWRHHQQRHPGMSPVRHVVGLRARSARGRSAQPALRRA